MEKTSARNNTRIAMIILILTNYEGILKHQKRKLFKSTGTHLHIFDDGIHSKNRYEYIEANQRRLLFTCHCLL